MRVTIGRNTLQQAVSRLLAPLGGNEVSITGAATATPNAAHVCSGTSADYTLTLPSCASMGKGWVNVRMDMALTKFVTLDGAGSDTIDGALTRVMWKGESALLHSDGASNWSKLGGKSLPMTCTIRLSASTTSTAVAVSTIYTVLINSTDTDNTGLMADTANNRIIVRRTSMYTANAVLIWQPISGAINRLITQIRRDPNSGTYATLCQAELGQPQNAGPALHLVQNGLTLTLLDKVQLVGYQDHASLAQGIYGAVIGNSSTYLNVTEQTIW